MQWKGKFLCHSQMMQAKNLYCEGSEFVFSGKANVCHSQMMQAKNLYSEV